MFSPDPAITFIPPVPARIVSIIESINHPRVVVPGHPPQDAQIFIVGVRNNNGSFSIYIYLYLIEESAQVVYSNSVRELDVRTFPAIEQEALDFAETMGFMVDNLNFRNLNETRQLELLDDLPCFHKDLQAFKARREALEGEGAVDPAALAPEPAAPQPSAPAPVQPAAQAAPQAVAPAQVAPAAAPEAPSQVRTAAFDGEHVQRIARLLASF